MLGYNFTERVRKALAFAREEAGQLRHEYVGTEHILLGIVREGEGVASSVLVNQNVKLEAVRQATLAVLKAGKAPPDRGPDLPYTSRAKKVLELAMSEAREFGHNYVGTEHLLLGLLREERGIAAQTLVSLGVTADSARASVVEILKDDPRPRAMGIGMSVGRSHVYAGITFFPTRLLLTVSGFFAAVIGLMLIFNARGFEAPMGIAVDDWTETIAQAQGAILLGLGVTNWLARDVKDRAALWAILYGNFVVQVVSFAIVARALTRGLIPAAGFGALAMHIVLGAAFALQLQRLKRAR